MIVPEDSAKELMARRGLRIPPGRSAGTPGEAEAIARDLHGACVVKALIPAGGRGAAGGVVVCASVEAAREAAERLLGHELLGHAVTRVRIEAALPAVREVYAGVVAHPATNTIDLILSLTGGVEVEDIAQAVPHTVERLAVEPGDVLPVHRVRTWLAGACVPQGDGSNLAEVLTRLYRAAADLDATLLEVNPLVLLPDRSLVVLDCKLEVDDNALPRQPELAGLYVAALSSREQRARALGVSFVPLDGDIGVIASGAGLGMATIDLLKREGLAPANFLDTGGGISESLLQSALELVLEPPGVRGVIVNLYGGINRMLEAARGISAVMKNVQGHRPVVVKILGNQQEEAWAVLGTEPDVHVIRVAQTEAAVARLAELVG